MASNASGPSRRDNLGIDTNSIIMLSSDSDEETIVVTSGPSRTASKRKAPGTPGSQPAQKRSQASQPAREVCSKATSQEPARDQRFWYPDGNVVIKVQQTCFKLFRSRLAKQCRYFQELFSPPTRSQPVEPSSSTNVSRTGGGDGAPCRELDGCTVYEVSGIDPSDFTAFINFLEYPLDHPVSTASGDTLYALLRASDVLGCDVVHGLAKTAIADQWPSLQTPENSNTEVLRTLSPRRAHGAIQAIVHARKYRIHSVLKRAFYELLRNVAFWDAVRRTHGNSGAEPPRADDRAMLTLLSRGDLVCLQQARWELREAWDVLLHTPPGSDTGRKGMTCNICPRTQAGGQLPGSRENAWAVELADAGSLVSFRDPITRTYCIEE